MAVTTSESCGDAGLGEERLQWSMLIAGCQRPQSLPVRTARVPLLGLAFER